MPARLSLLARAFTEYTHPYHRVYTCIHISKVFPGGSDSKESACNTGDMGSIPGLGRSPGEGHGDPLRYSCLENSMGQRTLADYSPWGHRVGHN